MTARVSYCGSWPTKVREVVEPLISDSLDLLPPWIWEAWIYYSREEDDPAVTTTEEAYGVIKIEIGHSFIDSADDYLPRIIRHEMMHAVTDPIVQVAHEAIEIVRTDNDALATHLTERMRRAMEQSTSGLEHVITRKMEAREKLRAIS